MSVNMSGSGAVGLGVGVGSYQPRVYVPLKALFLVFDTFFYNLNLVIFLHFYILKVTYQLGA